MVIFYANKLWFYDFYNLLGILLYLFTPDAMTPGQMSEVKSKDIIYHFYILGHFFNNYFF